MITFATLHDIANAIRTRNNGVTVEVQEQTGTLWIQLHIEVAEDDRRLFILGNQNEDWTVDIYASPDSFGDGPMRSETLPLASSFMRPELVASRFLCQANDVCISGNPAWFGMCDQSDCVCHPFAAPNTVGGYFDAKLGAKPSPAQFTIPLDSVCGTAAKTIIDKADELMSLCDPATHDAIREAVNAAVDTVCFS